MMMIETTAVHILNQGKGRGGSNIGCPQGYEFRSSVVFVGKYLGYSSTQPTNNAFMNLKQFSPPPPSQYSDIMTSYMQGPYNRHFLPRESETSQRITHSLGNKMTLIGRHAQKPPRGQLWPLCGLLWEEEIRYSRYQLMSW